ncbi:Hsp20/alpha crystallin family protein [Halogeometricum borinquense]|uniref:Hsp20/alpha crystallin family protein n=1 Tax=Halogeometricum borinquense TaxID=60847 RepID=A0A6C0UK20_9EURY|nr:Hsp20/alpha crystallin family protein [Halogeometricum borinquense]QIB75852.1 Hsp20/alpha crystallin family protein [Halogeometricum borinquense]QIQ75564.1 Hsp20/alpha crystallin family protein [Halogeometricum borinquense]
MLPERPTNAWTQGLDLPSRLFSTGRNDYELYEEDGEFVLSVEMPGFDPEEITVTWDDAVLNVAAEHEDEARGRRKTYHRRFRFPKNVDDEGIAATYNNGILQVTLPVATETTAAGKQIEIES